MTCKYCKHFSARGEHKDGKFIQNTNDSGEKTGWCQHSPPTVDKWPVVSEKEHCGQYKKVLVESYYYDLYNKYSERCRVLEIKVRGLVPLHKVIEELAPLVGRKKKSGKLNTLKAVKEALKGEKK